MGRRISELGQRWKKKWDEFC